MSKVDVSIILACYNEGPTLEQEVAKIISVCRKSGKTWELVFVEDKSSDQTKAIVEKLNKRIVNSQAIYHRTNQGRGKSVSDGLKLAKGVICGYLDVDLEINADYIPIFLKEVENGADMVVGKRFYERPIRSLSRSLASRTYSQMVKFILKIPIEDTETGYKFFEKAKILPILTKARDKGWFWDTEICARAYWAGLKISQIPVLFIRRRDKKSTVKLISDSIKYIGALMVFRSQIPKSFK